MNSKYSGVSFIFPAKRVLAIFLFFIFIRNLQTFCRRDFPKPIIRSQKLIPFTQFLFLQYLERSTQIKKSHESSKKLIREKIKHLNSRHGTEKMQIIACSAFSCSSSGCCCCSLGATAGRAMQTGRIEWGLSLMYMEQNSLCAEQLAGNIFKTQHFTNLQVSSGRSRRWLSPVLLLRLLLMSNHTIIMVAKELTTVRLSDCLTVCRAGLKCAFRVRRAAPA